MLKFQQFINEGGLARLMQHEKENNTGVISADRAGMTYKQKRDARKSLESDLRAKGYGFKKQIGHFGEDYGDHKVDVTERSYHVNGKKGDDGGHLKNTLKELGTKYKQDAIIHKGNGSDNAHMITTAPNHPDHGKEEVVGKWHPKEDGPYYSSLKKNKPNTNYRYALPKTNKEI